MATDLTPTPKGQLRNVDMYGQGRKTETDDGKWVDLLRRLGKKKNKTKKTNNKVRCMPSLL